MPDTLTVVERDTNIPELSELVAEAKLPASTQDTMLSLRDIQARVAGLHGDANALDGVIAEGAFSAASG